MKKPLYALLAALLVACLSTSCLAFETDFDDLRRFDRNLPAWKFGRGVANILSFPYEVASNMVNNAIEGDYYGAYDQGLHGSIAGSINGYVAGFFPGIVKGARRLTTGMVEIATFWKPEYGPTIDPTYGTRCKAWGQHDYFNPEPFWYSGPDRW